MTSPDAGWWIFSTARPTRQVVRRVVPSVALCLAVAACSGDSPTNPDNGPPVMLTNSASFAEMIRDDQVRVIPSMPANPKRAALQASFEALFGALQVGEVRPVEDALDASDSALQSYALALGIDSGYGADLDALRLSMDVIEAQLMVDMLTGR